MIRESLPRRLALVRHGMTEAPALGGEGERDAGLSAEGRRQALNAAGRLAYSRWSWIATSPLDRALQTARMIAVEFPLAPVTECAKLIEGRSGGPGDRTVRASGSTRDLGALGAETIDGLMSTHDGDGIIVSHGPQLSAIIAELCAIEPPSLAPGAVVVLRQMPSEWQVSGGTRGMTTVR